MAIEVEAFETDDSGRSRFRVRARGHVFEVTALPVETESLGAPDAISLIRASFEFLLEREPVDSILPRFDLAEIGRYFPTWRTQMRRRFNLQ